MESTMELNDCIYRSIMFLENNNDISDQTIRYKDKIVKVVKIYGKNKTVKGYRHFISTFKSNYRNDMLTFVN